MTPLLAGNSKKISPERMRQYPLATIAALLYLLSIYIFYQQGIIRWAALLTATTLILSFIILFYATFKFGLNRNFREPHLTAPLISAAVFTMVLVAYLDRATQVSLGPFMLTAFLFGVFHLSARTLLRMAAISLGLYLLMILLRGNQQGYPPAFRHDLMQWFVLAVTLTGVIMLGKQIRNLRTILETTRYQLEHYEEKSIRDELTGTYNRRQLLIELAQSQLKANSLGVPFCICLIDIDHFKSINDKNGHLAGDLILQKFVGIAQESLRSTDVFGRYGGDEFMHILPDTELKGAVMHAERLRIYSNFLDLQSTLQQKNISLSIGVVQYRPHEEIADMIARADAALYLAKKNGRNRVEWEE
jgi:diguanylate cyclase